MRNQTEQDFDEYEICYELEIEESKNEESGILGLFMFGWYFFVLLLRNIMTIIYLFVSLSIVLFLIVNFKMICVLGGVGLFCMFLFYSLI